MHHAMKIALAVSETIREAGSVPSGVLYSHLLGQLTMDQYTAIIGALKGAGLVAESNHVLRWVGPALAGG